MPSRANLPTPANGAPSNSSVDTRERLVQAAVNALYEHGPAGFKVLDIAARAGANVALINRYFGGRDGLLREVLRREGLAVAKARAARLEEVVTAWAPQPPPLKEVMEAWLKPVFDAVQSHQSGFMNALLCHLLFATDLNAQNRNAMLGEVDQMDARFVDVLALCLPGVPRRTLAWRLALAIGSYNFVFGQEEPNGWRVAAREKGPPSGFREAYEEMLAFMMGGFGAPPTAWSAEPPSKTRRRLR